MLKHTNELKELNLPIGQYSIVGSGPLAVRNLRDANNINIIVSWNLWEDLKSKYPNYLEQETPSLIINNIKIYPFWFKNIGMNVDEMISTSEYIDGLPFVRLEYVLKWKKKQNREKDKADVILIEKYLGG